MTSASIGRFAGKALLGLLVVCAVLSMAGCGPTTDPESQKRIGSLKPWLYKDTVTGCEYLSTRNEYGLEPRIAADGKTHMGCKGVR